jgi:hypothetical protein
MASKQPLTRTFEAVIPATAAGADFEIVICKAPFAGTLSAASYTPDTDITGANTDSRTIQVINKAADGNGTTVMASKAYTLGVNATDFNEETLTLSATAADLVVAAGDIIVGKSLHVGSTGLADPGGTFIIELTRS